MGTPRRADATANDQRLLEAARDVFAAHGYDAPVAAVAAAAGIGMGSLYRRFASKDELLADVCLRSMRQMADLARMWLDAPTSAAGRLTGFVRACVDVRCGAFAGVAGHIPVTAEMVAASRDSQRLADRLLTAARRDGAVRADIGLVDVLRLIELFGRSPREPGDEHVRDRLLGIALDGLCATTTSLPRPVPTLREYRERWRTPPTTVHKGRRNVRRRGRRRGTSGRCRPAP